MEEFLDKYENFGHDFSDFLLRVNVLKSRNAFQKKVIDSLPILMDGGRAYSTFRQWLINGKCYVMEHDVVDLVLLDVCPFFNGGVCYFFVNHSGDQLNPDVYDGFCAVPEAWYVDITYDAVLPQSNYSGAAINGWSSSEKAIKALSKSALIWAKGNTKPAMV